MLLNITFLQVNDKTYLKKKQYNLECKKIFGWNFKKRGKQMDLLVAFHKKGYCLPVFDKQ